MSTNTLMIAAAGAGKTTYLVNQALDASLLESNKKILITTYTRSNANQIREIVLRESRKRNIANIFGKIIVLEWYRFLLQEGG